MFASIDGDVESVSLIYSPVARIAESNGVSTPASILVRSSIPTMSGLGHSKFP